MHDFECYQYDPLVSWFSTGWLSSSQYELATDLDQICRLAVDAVKFADNSWGTARLKWLKQKSSNIVKIGDGKRKWNGLLKKRSTKSSKSSRNISSPFASSPDTTQKSNYLFPNWVDINCFESQKRTNGMIMLSLKGHPFQTDAAIMMLLDKLGPTPSHVTATKRIAKWYPVGKGQPHIVHGKLEQGCSAAPLLARDTKTEPGGFAYVPLSICSMWTDPNPVDPLVPDIARICKTKAKDKVRACY
ncbi:hypothetical protein Tco_0545080 [Tanacetum coccineum]